MEKVCSPEAKIQKESRNIDRFRTFPVQSRKSRFFLVDLALYFQCQTFDILFDFRINGDTQGKHYCCHQIESLIKYPVQIKVKYYIFHTRCRAHYFSTLCVCIFVCARISIFVLVCIYICIYIYIYIYIHFIFFCVAQNSN